MKKQVLQQGQRFSKLVVVKLNYTKIQKRKKNNHIQEYYLCKCDCGNYISVLKESLKNGNTKSCGCLQKEKAREQQKKICYKDNRSKTRLYKIYLGIKRRCYNKNDNGYKNYGGRNIIMCDDWFNNYNNFKKWSLNNNYNDNLTIERINVNGNYEPNNCKWVEIQEQHYNKRNTLFINGFNMKELKKITGLKYNTLYARIKKNKSFENIIDFKIKKNQYL